MRGPNWKNDRKIDDQIGLIENENEIENGLQNDRPT